MRRLITVVFMITSIVRANIWGQDVASPEPNLYVSRLKAVVDGSRITLTWRDKKDVSGVNLIYRYVEKINKNNYSAAELIGRVNQGVQTYEDYPPSKDNYYYSVLIQDDTGLIHTVFISFRNVTNIGVAVERLVTEEDLAATITEIETAVSDDSVVVSFSVDRTDRDLLIFRSNAPLSAADELLEAVSPVTVEGSVRQYRDFPIPGIDYYYAVVDAGLFRVGNAYISPEDNSTTTPISIPVDVERIGLPELTSVRPIPLPFLQISSGVESGNRLIPSLPFAFPEKKSVAPATVKAIARIVDKISLPQPPPSELSILPPEKEKIVGDEKFTLQMIVQQSLMNNKLKETERLLLEFMNLHHPANVEARAHFYLGQVYYFQSKVREALMQFLQVRDHYIKEVRPWIDACFDKLTD